jgi:ankyrin repeat protein
MANLTELHKAAMFGQTFRIQTLINDGAKTEAYDSKGFTPLMCAVSGNKDRHIILIKSQKGNHTDCVEMLIKNNANVNCKDKEGSTPLHIACTLLNLEAVQVLVRSGANVNAMDKNGTPLHNCCTGNQEGYNSVTEFNKP